MTYLLDTCAVSELRRSSRRADPGFTAWAQARDPLELALSAVTVFELEVGVSRMERRDLAQGAVLRRWLEGAVLDVFRNRVLPVDEPIARVAARLNVPDQRPDRDALIAATAIVRGLSVVTRNVRDFAPMNVPIIDPWSGSGAES